MVYAGNLPDPKNQQIAEALGKLDDRYTIVCGKRPHTDGGDEAAEGVVDFVVISKWGVIDLVVCDAADPGVVEREWYSRSSLKTGIMDDPFSQPEKGRYRLVNIMRNSCPLISTSQVGFGFGAIFSEVDASHFDDKRESLRTREGKAICKDALADPVALAGAIHAIVKSKRDIHPCKKLMNSSQLESVIEVIAANYGCDMHEQAA
jgi:hypothetical protein